MRLLEILEIDVNTIQQITHPIQFENIILPDESFGYGECTNEYCETIDRLRNFALKNQTPTSSKKFYFFYGKTQVGEERMAEYFHSKGYEIISHEQRLNFDDELNILINAESFAAPLGSVAQNSVFLRDGTETILIPRSANKFWPQYQQVIDQIHSLNTNYLDSTLSICNIDHDLFCFIISKQLKNFFGDEFDGYDEEDFKVFLTYLQIAFRLGRPINQTEIEGYGETFSEFLYQLKKREDLLADYGITLDTDTKTSDGNEIFGDART